MQFLGAFLQHPQTLVLDVSFAHGHICALLAFAKSASRRDFASYISVFHSNVLKHNIAHYGGGVWVGASLGSRSHVACGNWYYSSSS